MYHIGEVMIDAGKLKFLTMLFFLIVIVTSISDFAADIERGANVLHIVQEAVVCLLALSLLLILSWNARVLAKQNAQLLIDLNEAKIDSMQASKELISAKRNFGEEISKQFSSWGLTESESDIALFTLKGYSGKEIADFRHASDKTVRNQLTSVYKKSATTSKVSFIAWFMEGAL